MSARGSDEHSVRKVKACQGGVFWKLGKVGASRDRANAYPVAPLRVPLVVVHPLEECIAYAGLPIRAKVVAVFFKDPTIFVQNNRTRVRDLLQSSHARDDAILRCLGALATSVGHTTHVSVNDDSYLLPAFCLSMAATVMSASSPISSPKKCFGQFLIFPYGSTSSSSIAEAPFSKLQK